MTYRRTGGMDAGVRKIHEGYVIVTRSPCFHPGDIRVLPQGAGEMRNAVFHEREHRKPRIFVALVCGHSRDTA